ncbi:MAG: HD domain-containing phosphohydrolase [Psychrobium sp.]
MNSPKEPVLLTAKCLEQQTQLNATFEQLTQELTLGAVKRLKAQILVLSDWLFSLNEENSDLVLGQALCYPKHFLPHTNHAFCQGIIAAKFCHRQHYHGQHAKLFISSALTMNITLLLTGISAALFQQKKLSPQQIKQYQQYPISSGQFLNKYHVIEKAALGDIINHRELLDGSGFPTQIMHHQLTDNMRMLAIIAKFIDLTSPRINRAGYRTKQALSYLSQHRQQYDIDLLNLLINLVDKPLPGLIYKLNKNQHALITQVSHYTNELQCQAFSIEQGHLQFESTTQQDAIDTLKNYLAPPSAISDRIINQSLQEFIDQPLEDISDQTQRLKPSDDLTLLLNELSAHIPEQEAISELIARQPVLGDQLIKHLQQQYPSSQFNSSFHALQMAGYSQAKPLLSRLALESQLSQFTFINGKTLRQKINFAVSTSQWIAQQCQHVLPHQLAIFILLNLAPLYLERIIINGARKRTLDITKCHIHHAYSLAGHNNSTKQQKVSMALAKIWAPQTAVLNALSANTAAQKQNTGAEQELVVGFELAIYLTHHVYHHLSLNELLADNRLITTMRQLKINTDMLQKIISQTLASRPMCEL